MTALLEIRSVAVRFGGVMALSGVDLDVQKIQSLGSLALMEPAKQPSLT